VRRAGTWLGEPQPEPLAHHVGACHEIAHPLAPQRRDRREQRRDAREDVELHHTDEGAHEGVAERDRPGVEAYDAQAERPLPERAAPGQRLRRRGDAHHDAHDRDEDDHGEECPVEARCHGRDAEDRAGDQQRRDGQVDGAGHGPHPHARDR